MTRAEPRRSLQSPDGIRTQLVSLGTGAVLALLGAAEARRLARADPSEAQKRARQLGFIRTGVAAAFLIKPTLLPRLLGMDDDDRSASRWLPRLFAVRELIIGGGAIADSTRGRDPYPALLAISAVDGVESLLLLEALRRRELPRARALGFVLADLGSATAFPIVLKRLIATTPSSRDPAVHPS